MVFEVSEQKINTFENFSRSSSARYNTHNIKQQKPLIEFEGPGADTVSFDVKLRASHGVNPLVELEKWKKAYRRGYRGIITLGKRPLSVYTFAIIGVTENHTTFDQFGNVLTIELSLELIEYPLPAKDKNKAKPKENKDAAPAAKKQKGTVTITVKSVHIRSGPGVKNKVLGYAYRNNAFKVYGTKNGWYDLGGGKYMTAASQYSKFKAVT